MATHGLLNSTEDSAIARLDHVVATLTRQRRWYQLARYLADSLFWGLVVSALAVLYLRLAGLPELLLPVVVCLIALSLCAGSVLAWRHKPAGLTTAILADARLGLKQRLSTAWEYRQQKPDTNVSRALAMQVVGRRHAVVSGVFPFELNLTGMLIPLAAALLILANIVDLREPASTPADQIDFLLAEEGKRLKLFAEQMKLQAQREKLARSLHESDSIQQLGADMEAGAMQREQALERLAAVERSLSRQRDLALRDAQQSSHSPIAGIRRGENNPAGSEEQRAAQPTTLSPDSTESLQQIRSFGLSSIKSRLSAGELSAADLQSLENAAEMLRETGSDSAAWGDELRNALDQYADGDTSELKRVLESLTQTEQQIRDAEELDEARAAISRASENLGGQSIFKTNRIRATDNFPASEAGDAEQLLEGGVMADFQDAQLTAGDGLGRSQAKFEVLRESGSSGAELSSDSSLTLKPESKPNAGESFKSQTWSLPEIGDISVDSVQLNAQFRQQLEAVQAKESIPLHRKEFLRRYFLNLHHAVEESGSAEEISK